MALSSREKRMPTPRYKRARDGVAVAALQCLFVVTFAGIAGANAWACEAVGKDQNKESNCITLTAQPGGPPGFAVAKAAAFGASAAKHAWGDAVSVKRATTKIVVAANDDCVPPTQEVADSNAPAPSVEPVPPGADRVDHASEIDLQSVRARALLGLGNIGGARTEAAAVLAQRPHDIAALGVLAMADESQDLWRQAASRWSEVYSLNGDPAAAARRDALVGAHPSHVTVTAFFEGASGSDQQQGVRAQAALRPLNGPEWTAQIETRQAEADQAIRLNGLVGPISLQRQRAEIGVADTFSFGRLGVSVTASNSEVGAHATFGQVRKWGSFEFIVGANEPYWLYSTGIVNEATSDYVGASISAARGRFGARAATRLSNYGVADDNSVARSTRVSLGVDAAVSGGKNPLRLSYVLDGEYFDSVQVRTRAGGSRYSPMPFTDREVHSLGAYKSFGDAARTFVTLGAGYRDDRYGANGPFASVTAEGAIAHKVRIGVRMEYSEPSIRGLGDESYSFGEIYVRRVF